MMNNKQMEADGAPADPEIDAILDYLVGTMPPAEARRFEARTATDPALRASVDYWREARDQLRHWNAAEPPGIDRLDELDWDKIKSTARHFAPAPSFRNRANAWVDRYFRLTAMHSGLAFSFTVLLIILSVFVVLWSSRNPESRRGRLDFANEERAAKPLGSVTVPPISGGVVGDRPRR